MREIEVYWTEYYWMDKKEQYKLMLKRQPEIFQRISLKDSFLFKCYSTIVE